MKNKIGIIGVGHVGAHCAFSLAMQGVARELVLVDTNTQKSVSEAQDLVDSVAYLPHHVQVQCGSYEDLADCDIVVNSVGTIVPGDRLAEMQKSVDLLRGYAKRMVKAGFAGILINITNPCDIIARELWRETGLPKNRVLGTGTGLDSARLRAVLARETGVDHQSISAFMLGEHGESQMAPWSAFTFGGLPLAALENRCPARFGNLDKAAIVQEVRRAGWVTLAGKGATEFGIAATLTMLAACILRDEKKILPVSALLEGQYGQEDIFCSTPCLIGASGVEQVFELPLTEPELAEYRHSCAVIREHTAMLR